jgi:hypothetical protein
MLTCSKLGHFQTLYASNRNSQCREGNCLIKETGVVFKSLADILNDAVWCAIWLKQETFASMQIAMLLIFIIYIYINRIEHYIIVVLISICCAYCSQENPGYRKENPKQEH